MNDLALENWIKRVVDSCENSQHLASCKRLIDNFYRITNDEIITELLLDYHFHKYNDLFR